MGCDLNDVDLSVRRSFDGAGQRGGAIEVVQREHYPGRDGVLPYRLVRQFTKGFHLDVAPLTADLAGLHQPVKLGFDASREASSSSLAAAGDQKGGTARTVTPQPGQEARALGIAGKPVDAKFNGGGFPVSRADLRGHLDSPGSRGHGTDARQPLSECS